MRSTLDEPDRAVARLRARIDSSLGVDVATAAERPTGGLGT